MPYSKKKASQIYNSVELLGEKKTARAYKITVASVKRAHRDHIRNIDFDVPVSRSSLSDYGVQKAEKAPILILPDLHGPYHHPDAIEFLKWVQETRGCREEVQSVGDLIDFHAMSRFTSETDAMSAEEEYEQALRFTSELTSAFPKGNVVLGNHCQIPQRQMKSIGLTPSMLKNNNDLYGLPGGWRVEPFYNVLEPDDWDVLVEHGIGSAGKYGCANTAIRKRCSYVQGHVHSASAVIYNQNHDSLIFGMNVGCLVDSKALAFRYGKYGTSKGVLGCGVVYSGEHAEFIPISSFYKAKGLKAK